MTPPPHLWHCDLVISTCTMKKKKNTLPALVAQGECWGLSSFILKCFRDLKYRYIKVLIKFFDFSEMLPNRFSMYHEWILASHVSSGELFGVEMSVTKIRVEVNGVIFLPHCQYVFLFSLHTVAGQYCVDCRGADGQFQPSRGKVMSWRLGGEVCLLMLMTGWIWWRREGRWWLNPN